MCSLMEGVEPQTATPVPDKNGPSTFIIIFCLLVSAGLLALGIVLIYFGNFIDRFQIMYVLQAVKLIMGF